MRRATPDPRLVIDNSPSGFGSPQRSAMFVMADGSARFLDEDTDPEVLQALATPASHERPSEYD